MNEWGGPARLTVLRENGNGHGTITMRPTERQRIGDADTRSCVPRSAQQRRGLLRREDNAAVRVRSQAFAAIASAGASLRAQCCTSARTRTRTHTPHTQSETQTQHRVGH